MYLFLLLCIFLSASSTKHLRTKPKFCVNCKYFIPSTTHGSNNEYYAKCGMFPSNNSDFLVSGIKNPANYYYCYTARSWGSDMCGPDAKKYKRLRRTKGETTKKEPTNPDPSTT